MSDTTVESFLKAATTRTVTPVVRRLFADSETPMGLYRKLASGVGSFLLESADQGGKWSRYSFMGVSVHGILLEKESTSLWRSMGMSEQEAFGQSMPVDPLEALRVLNQRWVSDPVPGLPPFSGGLVGHLGWEIVRFLERLPNAPSHTHRPPSVFLSLVKDFVAFDHHTSEVVLVSLVHSQVPAGESQYLEALSRIEKLHKTLASPTSSTLHQRKEPKEVPPEPSIAPEDFYQMVERAKRHIADGDVFQVVLSQQFTLPVTAQALSVYRVLRQLNPSPYMYLLECEDANGVTYQVVGSSPEALVSVRNKRVYSHPIAGSRPRGDTPEHDASLAEGLREDTKEQAEHLMLVDLARNDLSKVCVAGSVDVTEFMQVERFSHIMHLVSSVEGELRSDQSSVDVLRATFPAGTLSGAPKPRALEIIDDVEPTARGVYGGVVGYFGHSGDADLAITIRTVWMSEGLAIVQAGAGIVADSKPVSEYEETIHKASAPVRAVRLANALQPDRQ
jgi:anthranilate synthase component 1